MKKKTSKNSSLPGFEPGIFWSVVRRVIRCATGPCYHSVRNFAIIKNCSDEIKRKLGYQFTCTRGFPFFKSNFITTVLDYHKTFSFTSIRSRGAIDSAFDYESKGWRFESSRDQNIFWNIRSFWPFFNRVNRNSFMLYD